MAETYPEHEKLQAVAAESQAIGEFLDGSPYVLCERKHVYNGVYWTEPVTKDGRTLSRPVYVAVHQSIPVLLADWFDIDLTKLEAEKRSMVEHFDQLRASA